MCFLRVHWFSKMVMSLTFHLFVLSTALDCLDGSERQKKNQKTIGPETQQIPKEENRQKSSLTRK